MNLDFLEQLYKELQPYCKAIYLGGSRVDPIIKKPHDYDIVIFTIPGVKPKDIVKKVLNEKRKLNLIPRNHDFIDIVDYSNIKINLSSYLYKYCSKIVGEELDLNIDILGKYKSQFIEAIKKKAEICQIEIPWVKKRWYQILRAIYILQNNSYEVTPEQEMELNILHDLADGWEIIKVKTSSLLDTIN